MQATDPTIDPTIDPTDPRRQLRAFITSNFYIPAGDALDEATSFLASGILDSTGVLELVTFVEAEYGLTITDDELVPANFDSITALAGFIQRKRKRP